MMVFMKTSPVRQQCMMPVCAATFDLSEVLYACPKCGGLLDVRYDWSHMAVPASLSYFSSRRGNEHGPADASGVWRFRELLPLAPVEDLVTVGEGRTILQAADELAAVLGARPGSLFLQYEGFNPSGSFKDNGMAAGFTIARRLGRRRVACASTGNTSASLALFAARTRLADGHPMQAVVFVGSGKIALGKLAQALDYGAVTLQIDGDFDACMRLVRESATRHHLYLMNSVNPFRLEGQKTIMYRVLEGLGGKVPDWIIVPGGNLGNCSAFGKAFMELRELGLIPRMPRLAVINAAGANSLYELFHEHGVRFNAGAPDHTAIKRYFAQRQAAGRQAHTIASAIEIGDPVNLLKALRALEALDGVVRQVNDAEILDAKALVGRHGYGCEPASAAAVAGYKLLRREGVIAPSDRAVCILTGHALKDPDVTVRYHMQQPAVVDGQQYANAPRRVAGDAEAIGQMIGE